MSRRLASALLFAAVVALACTSISIAAAWAPTNGVHLDGRSPDTRDAALLAQQGSRASRRAAGSQTIVRGGRPHDTKAAVITARSTPSPVIVLAGTGFDWVDASIGAAAGFGLATITAAALALIRNRQRTIAS